MTRAAWPLCASLAVLTLAPLSVTAQTSAAPAAPLTLEGAIAQALQRNGTIVAARLRRPIDLANVDVARERPNPSIEYDTERETPREAITAAVPIELGGKRDRRTELARATVATGEATLASTIAGVRNDVRRAYFALVAAEAHVTLAEDVRTLAARARDAAAARFAVGDVPRLEDMQAALELANADDDVTAAHGERIATEAELNVLLGQPPAAPLTLADPLTTGTLPALSDAVAEANQSNIDLAVLDHQIAEEIARRDLAKSLQTPDITAGGSFTFDAQPDFGVGWRTSLNITVPIFTRHRAGVVVENATLTELHAERDARAAEIAAAVAAAFARATAARDQMTHYQNDILPELGQLDAMAQDGYQAGQTNLVALLEALRSTRDSRARGLDAGLSYQQALADLEKAMGAVLR